MNKIRARRLQGDEEDRKVLQFTILTLVSIQVHAVGRSRLGEVQKNR